MLNLKSSHEECLDENAVKLHYSMPDLFYDEKQVCETKLNQSYLCTR